MRSENNGVAKRYLPGPEIEKRKRINNNDKSLFPIIKINLLLCEKPCSTAECCIYPHAGLPVNKPINLFSHWVKSSRIANCIQDNELCLSAFLFGQQSIRGLPNFAKKLVI